MSGPEQIPGKLDRKPWKISSKTPNSVLKDSHTVNLYSAMTVDVNNNVRELVPSVDWNEVIWAHGCDNRGRSFTLNSITEGVFVRSLRPVAEQMGWGMHTPEVVYLSGLYFANAIDRVNAQKSRDLEGLNDPNKKFVPEIRQAKIERTNEGMKRFEGFKILVEDALRRYAAQKLTPGWRNYVGDIQKLFSALMNGRETEIDEMIRLLSVYPQREARINKKWRQREIGTDTVAVA